MRDGSYDRLLREKMPVAQRHGLEAIPPLSSRLRAYQADCVAFGLRAGRFGLFLDTGLGKTLVEFEWAKHAMHAEGEPALILTPLAVAPQMARMAEEFGYEARVIREMRDVKPGQINICNYDRLHLLDPDAFGPVVFDEGSIVKNYSGKVSRQIRSAFAAHRWKCDATATPAPNDHSEIGQAADLLGVMEPSEMRMRWFCCDREDGTWGLLPHGEQSFYAWTATWARMASHPRDLGHPEEGFETPGLRVIRHEVAGGEKGKLAGPLWGGGDVEQAMSATSMYDIKRQTAAGRAELIAGLVAGEPGENWIIWVDTDDESTAMRCALEELDRHRTIEVRGSQRIDDKEERLERFSTHGGWMISKTSIAGFGLNWQHCARQAFVGRTYSYLNFYQGVKRSDRFGQKRIVEVHLAIAKGEDVIGRVLDRKAADHRKMQEQMALAMRREIEAGGSPVMLGEYKPEHKGKLPAWIGEGEVECLSSSQTARSALYHGDCVKVLSQFPDCSIDLAVYSPPFSNLYIYSDSPLDMGNCVNDEEFLDQYRFLCEELYRVLRPGRLAMVHCKHRVYYQNQRGSAGVEDLPGKLIRVHQSAGFDLHGPPITIWRCPVREMTKTKSQGLLYKQLRADSTLSRTGIPEMILPLRRWPQTDEEREQMVPVSHTFESFPLDQWQQWASPVWGYEPTGDSLRDTDVLRSGGKEEGDEKHICPMPKDLIRRCVLMYSNPGETVLSPFGGIGSEPFVALSEGRKAVAIELKETYYSQARANVESAAAQGRIFG